jgi:DNA-binding beta-propeller fold protein YncE
MACCIRFALALSSCAIQLPAQERAPASTQAGPTGLQGYRVDPQWPQRPPDVTWGEIPGVAVDAKDNVWVFSRSEPHLQVYSPDGTFLKTWPNLEHKRAHYIKFDREGYVWLSDVGLHVVRKFTTDGRLLLTLGTPNAPGEDETHLNQPTDMAIAPTGDVFVSDGYGNNRVVHYDKNGRFVKAWGRKGNGPGEFNLPHAIAVDTRGRLYVADRSNARIQVFDSGGRLLEQWRNLLVPWSLLVTPQEEIWTSGSSPTLAFDPRGMTGIPPLDQVFMRFDTLGKLLELWCPKLGMEGQEKPGETDWVHALAADSKGNLYAGDIKGHRVQKFVRVR